jgi:tetratricopeptide (TPR) repeat protein
MAAKNLAEDNKTLGQDDAEAAAAKDGTALVNSGLNYVLHGSSEKGLEMMEQGLRKGGLKYPDDARLRLGYAYHAAGQNQKAIRILKTVHGTDGAASLARLWIIRLGRES